MQITGVIPSGSTRLFPVLGDPIAQVRSPSGLTRILAERGDDSVCVPMHVSPPDLPKVFEALHAIRNVGGMLITVPHKNAAYALCQMRTDRADFVRSVNVVRKTDDGWIGDNTDGLGYLNGLEREGFHVRERRALLVGCGGAGSAIALEIMIRGAAGLAIHDIDIMRRDAVIAALTQRFPGKITIGSADPSGYDLVANATPLGMLPDDPLPVDVSRLEAWQFVACVVTKPEIPPLIEEARKRGCGTMTGRGMFDGQAETLVEFLLARPAPSGDIP
ncbi:shikimate dehydrogenase family protein [Neorhizobium sp. DT-125]|uniref:shikimate dehydrogenase family protein n=1 Tax=Neorhizobium sp. DT-125 TaxID=3396163 RepID=UPI003F1AD4DB